MSIPPLLATGLLPAGLHDATLAEVAEVFGSSSQRRRELQRGLEQVASAARATGLFIDLIIDGSYVTDIQDPGDIDAILRTEGEFWSVVAPLERDPVNDWLLDAAEIKRRYGVYAVLDDAGGHWLDFYSRLKPEEALERRLAPDTVRGLVRVSL